MKSPGSMLREAREERGLALDDVAAMTRIPRGMLEHLEEDRFEEYVAEVFVRGHLRNYAQELRLDVDEVLQCYERHTGRHGRDPLMTPVGMGSEEAARFGVSIKDDTVATSESALDSMGIGGHFGSFRRSHLVAVVLILAGVFILFGYLSNNRATAQDPAEYHEAEDSNWELEQNVEQTRWLLERTD